MSLIANTSRDGIDSEDRRILVNYQEDGEDDDLLDNGFGNSLRIPPSAFAGDDPVLATISRENEQKFHSNLHSTPPDRFNYSYLIFYVLGSATMAPWNFFITANEYWMDKFRNTTCNDTSPLADLTPMQKSFTSDLTVAASVSGTTFLILNAIWGHHVSLRMKMIGTMTVIVLLFILTTGFVEVNTDDWQQGFFLMTMGIVVVLNVCSAVMSGGLFGIAGLFPSEYMTAVVSGQALGGIFTALAFILALTFRASPTTTAFVYFSIGIGIVFISLVSYAIMARTDFFKYHVYEKSKCLIGPQSSSAVDGVGVEMTPSIRNIFRKIYVYAVSECFVFAVTLSVYPAVTVLVKSQYAGNGQPWNDTYFLPVVNYFIFNSGDYLGRILAGLIEMPKNNPHLILLLTIVRAICIPLFMTANIVPHYFLPTIIERDVTFIILMAGFALTNGYLANICLIMVPRTVMQHEKEMASSIMAASLSLGLALGAITSMALVQLV